MTDTELLLVIAIATIVTTLIQCIEMWMLISSSRRTNELLSQPGDIIVSLVEQLQNDKKFAATFMGFVGWLGQVTIAGAKEAVQQAGVYKPPKIKSVADLLSFALQLPAIQNAVEKKIVDTVGGEAVKTATEAVGGGW